AIRCQYCGSMTTCTERRQGALASGALAGFPQGCRSDLEQFDHCSVRVRHANEAGLGALRVEHLRLREKFHPMTLELFVIGAQSFGAQCDATGARVEQMRVGAALG